MEPPQYNGGLLGLQKREYLATVHSGKGLDMKEIPKSCLSMTDRNLDPRQNLSGDDYGPEVKFTTLNSGLKSQTIFLGRCGGTPNNFYSPTYEISRCRPEIDQ